MRHLIRQPLTTNPGPRLDLISFLSPVRSFFVLGLAAGFLLLGMTTEVTSVLAKADIDELIYQNARLHGLPSSLVRAIIKTESNFNRYAVSPKGAQGLMQLMPETGRQYNVKDPFNHEANIKAGTAYFRLMLDRFNSLTLALAAYNAGPDTVERYRGVPPISETKNFIRMVYKYYNHYRKEIDRHAPPLTPDWKAKVTSSK